MGDESTVGRRASLDTLPLEIQRSICVLFCGHCRGEALSYIWGQALLDHASDLHTLWALSLTCRALASAAQPVLFHRFLGDTGRPEIFQALLTRPDLARCVKQITPFLPDYRLTDEYGDLIDLLLDLAPRLHLTNLAGPGLTWGDVACGLSTLSTDVLISLLPELQALYMSPCPSWSGPEMSQWKGSWLENRFTALGGTPSLPHMRFLRLHSPFYGGGYSRSLQTLLRAAASSLEHLVMWLGHAPVKTRVDDLFLDLDDRALLPALPKLRTLEIQNSEVWPKSRFLRSLAKSSPLKRVKLWSHSPRGLYTTGMPEAFQVLEVLTPCRQTLTELEVAPGLQDGHCAERLGMALEAFPKLETLKLDERAFCRHGLYEHQGPCGNEDKTCLTNVLPRTVKNLVIRVADGGKVWEDIVHWGKQVAMDKFPHLERLAVDTRYGYRRNPSAGGFEDASIARIDAQLRLYRPMLREAFLGTSVHVSVEERFAEWRLQGTELVGLPHTDLLP